MISARKGPCQFNIQGVHFTDVADSSRIHVQIHGCLSLVVFTNRHSNECCYKRLSKSNRKVCFHVLMYCIGVNVYGGRVSLTTCMACPKRTLKISYQIGM